MVMSQVPLINVAGVEKTFGVPFHGHYSGANANAFAASTDNQIPLYEAASTVLIVLGVTDRAAITDVAAASAVTMRVSVVGGGSTVITTGELVAVYNITTTNGGNQRFTTPHYCAPGVSPRVVTSTSGQVDVVVHGYIERG